MPFSLRAWFSEMLGRPASPGKGCAFLKKAAETFCEGRALPRSQHQAGAAMLRSRQADGRDALSVHESAQATPAGLRGGGVPLPLLALFRPP